MTSLSLIAIQIVALAPPPFGLGDGPGPTSPRGVVLATVSADSDKVTYLPCTPEWVDASGRPVPKPEIQSLGKAGWLVSGWVSLVAPPGDLAALREETARRLQKPPRLSEIAPTSFGARVILDGNVLWDRPVADGKPKAMPVQFELPARPTIPDQVTLVVVLTWQENITAARGTVSVQWEKVERRVRAALNDGLLTEKELSVITAEAIEKGWIRSTSDANLRLGEYAGELIATGLLEPEAPVPADTGGTGGAKDAWQVRFRMRRAAKTEAMASTLDLTKSQTISRTAVRAVRLPVGPAPK